MGLPRAKVYDGIEGLRRRGLLPAAVFPPNLRVAGETLRACVQEGLTIGEIAGRVGPHPSNVAKRLRRLGLKPRPAGPHRRARLQRDRRRPRGTARGPRPTSPSHPQPRRS